MRCKAAGFTLIELLVVLVVIAIVTGSAITMLITNDKLTTLDAFSQSMHKQFEYARTHAVLTGKPYGFFLVDNQLVLRSFSRSSAFADTSSDGDDASSDASTSTSILSTSILSESIRSAADNAALATGAHTADEDVRTFAEFTRVFSEEPQPIWTAVADAKITWDEAEIQVSWLLETAIQRVLRKTSKELKDLLNFNDAKEEVADPPTIIFWPNGMVFPTGKVVVRFIDAAKSSERITLKWDIAGLLALEKK